MKVPKTSRRTLSSRYVFCMMDAKNETPTMLESHEPELEKGLVDGEEMSGWEVAIKVREGRAGASDLEQGVLHTCRAKLFMAELN